MWLLPLTPIGEAVCLVTESTCIKDKPESTKKNKIIYNRVFFLNLINNLRTISIMFNCFTMRLKFFDRTNLTRH